VYVDLYSACGVSVQGFGTSLPVKAELGKTSQWESGDAQRQGMLLDDRREGESLGMYDAIVERGDAKERECMTYC